MTRHCRIPLTGGYQGVPAARSSVWISQVLLAVAAPPRSSSGHDDVDVAAAVAAAVAANAYYCWLLLLATAAATAAATAGGMLSKPLPRWGLERLQRPKCTSCDSPPATAQVTANGILKKIPKPGRILSKRSNVGGTMGPCSSMKHLVGSYGVPLTI
ncbi:hypothetical protein GGI35DRAFT_207001 [Trichoderma velutinum]